MALKLLRSRCKSLQRLKASALVALWPLFVYIPNPHKSSYQTLSSASPNIEILLETEDENKAENDHILNRKYSPLLTYFIGCLVSIKHNLLSEAVLTIIKRIKTRISHHNSSLYDKLDRLQENTYHEQDKVNIQLELEFFLEGLRKADHASFSFLQEDLLKLKEELEELNSKLSSSQLINIFINCLAPISDIKIAEKIASLVERIKLNFLLLEEELDLEEKKVLSDALTKLKQNPKDARIRRRVREGLLSLLKYGDRKKQSSNTISQIRDLLLKLQNNLDDFEEYSVINSVNLENLSQQNKKTKISENDTKNDNSHMSKMVFDQNRDSSSYEYLISGGSYAEQGEESNLLSRESLCQILPFQSQSQKSQVGKVEVDDFDVEIDNEDVEINSPSVFNLDLAKMLTF